MRVFISYSHKDESLFGEFVEHLKAASRVIADIAVWEDTRLQPGEHWDEGIREALNAAQVVVALVSPGLMNSRYIWEKELAPALERESRGDCVIVPVIVRATPLWDRSVLGRPQVLPKDAKPMEGRRSRGRVWTEIVESLIAMAEKRGLLGGEVGDAAANKGKRSENKLFHLPFPRNPHFKGRAKELEWLETTLGKAGDRPVALLAGMGGVGKTSTAAEYAHRHRDAYDVVWWIEAQTEAGRDAGFAALATALKLPEATAPDVTALRAGVVKWMERTPGWLVVFDNAETPDELEGWLPDHPRGHVLITSRSFAWNDVSLVWDVLVWDPTTASDFLLERAKSKDRDRDREGAAALAEAVGFLPLACEQAGAYMFTNKVSIAHYRTLFAEHGRELLAEGAPKAHAPLDATVALSLESLEAANPLALEILRVLARLAPDDIPRDLLAPVESAEPLAVTQAVGELHRRALVRGAGEDKEETLSIHRLVRDLIRAADAHARESDGMAMWLLHEALGACGHPQTDIQHWPRLAALAPHATTLFDGLTGDEDDPPEPRPARFVCSQLGLFYLNARGDFTDARTWLGRAQVISERHLTADDPKLATNANNLGTVLHSLGDLAEAKTHFERALAIVEKTLGPDHSHVATLINNLGGLLLELGNLPEAKSHFERALAIDEKVFDPDHPNVAIRLTNLGDVLREMGDPTGAKPYLQHALAIGEKTLGSDHPELAKRLNIFGLMLWDLGDSAGAKAHLERALAIFEKLLPEGHPDIEQSRQNLAVVEAAIAAAGKTEGSGSQ